MTARISDNPGIVVGLIAVQSLCAAFFLWDVIEDMRPGGMASLTNLHILTESMAALALVSAILFEAGYLMRLLRRKAHLEQQVSIAAGAFHEIMQAHFEDWALTPAAKPTQSRALIKGLSIAADRRLATASTGCAR